MFAPFIPFIVLFCQVIETQDKQDLARLHGLVVFLQETTSLSDAAFKMHRLFQVLYSVALRFVEFRTTTPQAKQARASAEMDAYLAALGFPPKGAGGGGVGALEQQQSLHLQPQQQQQQNQQQQQQIMNFGQNVTSGSMDMTQANGGGIPAMAGDVMDESLRPGNPMMWMTNATQLEDFFYSNQTMMDLLQDPNYEAPQN